MWSATLWPAIAFELQTCDGICNPIGLTFHKGMLETEAGEAIESNPTRVSQGTSITLYIRDKATHELLIDKLPHWCRMSKASQLA